MAMTRTTHCGLDAVELRASDGASAVVTLHGAQVVSWRAAGTGGEQLYLSPRSAYADGTAIRGGVPVVFPQFSDRGPLVRHGFARSRPWRLLHAQRLPCCIVHGILGRTICREFFSKATILLLR